MLYILVKYYNAGMKIYDKISTRAAKDSVYDLLPIKRRNFIQTMPGLYKNEFVKKMIDALPTGS